MAPANVPATALSYFYKTSQMCDLAIGTNSYQPSLDAGTPFYWFIVVDLTNLKVVANEASVSIDSVPASVSQYQNNPQYFLYFVSNCQFSFNIPQGDLSTFLMKVGASTGLAQLDQMIEQLGTGLINNFSYILAATMAENDLPGFEALSVNYSAIMTMAFMPVTVNGQTIYAPIQLGGPV